MPTSYEILQDALFAIEVIVFLLSIWVYFKSGKHKLILVILAVMALTFLVELSGVILHYLYKNDMLENPNNLGVFNFYDLFVFMLWFYLFYQTLTLKSRKWIPIFASIVLLSFVMEWIFYHNLLWNSCISPVIIGSLLLTITISLYFSQILRDGSSTLLKRNIYFWVSCGLMMYYIINIPYNVVRHIYVHSTIAYLFLGIAIFVGSIMYILIGVGLIQYYKQHQLECIQL